MKEYLIRFSWFAAFASLSHAQSLPGTITKIPEQVYRCAAQAVVKITAGDRQRAGTGLIIGKTRGGALVILTANALISGFEEKLSVQLENQNSVVPAQLITDKWRNRDVALLATRAKMAGAAALTYGRSDQLVTGDEVAVLGFPQTSFLSQNAGDVARSTVGQITLDFGISPGQEGGPLIDKRGRVVGIAIAHGENRNEAIPVDLVRLMVEEWLHSAPLAEYWQEGKDRKHWYGWVLGVVLISAAGIAIGMSGVL